MDKKDFVRATMEKIALIKEYIEKYGDEDIIAYYNIHGNYIGIEDYLKKILINNNFSIYCVRCITIALLVSLSETLIARSGGGRFIY